MRATDPSLAQNCLTDHVAILALLVPWQDGRQPSALVVGSALLQRGQGAEGAQGGASNNDAVRGAQAKYLAARLERFNADFGAPVRGERRGPLARRPPMERETAALARERKNDI